MAGGGAGEHLIACQLKWACLGSLATALTLYFAGLITGTVSMGDAIALLYNLLEPSMGVLEIMTTNSIHLTALSHFFPPSEYKTQQISKLSGSGSASTSRQYPGTNRVTPK